MSLASRNRARVLSARIASIVPDGVMNAGRAVPPLAARPAPSAPTVATAPVHSAPASSTPESREAAQMALRFTHDMRRLKEIKSKDAKIAAKREMLPAYRAWIEGQLAADAAGSTGVAGEILPSCMVWLIDIGDYEAALIVGAFVLRHNVELPARYQRDAASVIVEEIADAALIAYAAGAAFPLDILDQVDALAIGRDLHDEIRAKLYKAIGAHRLAFAEDQDAAVCRPALASALNTLKEAARLNPRVGVKDRIKRTEKLLAALDQADAAELDQDAPADQAAAPVKPAPKPRAPRKPAAKPATKSAGKPAGPKARPRR